MAEGGSNTDLSSRDSTKHNLSDLHLLECPICLEQLRQPKCLPCLHSLCEECLSTYIVKETSGSRGAATFFTCPVCRKLTHPVDNLEGREQRAKQFPTDSYAVEMIQLAKQTTDALCCKPCKKKGNMIPAKFWCKVTQSLFCESCKFDFHDMVHTECDIFTIKGSDLFQLRPTTNGICDKHHRKKNFYCQDHKFVGCIKCMAVGHKDCGEDVTHIADYCRKLESRDLFDKNTTSLQLGVDGMESLIQDFYLQFQSNADDRDSALKNIEDMQTQISHRIAEKKREITDDLISKYKEERDHLKTSYQKCERLKAAMQNTLESSAKALMRNDLMNTVLLYQRGHAEVESCEQLVTEMLKSCSTTKIEHEFDFNASNIGTVLSLGKVVTRKQQKDVIAVLKSFKKPLSRCELKEIRKVNIKCQSDKYDCASYGVVYFHDGRIVVGDNKNRKIKLINVAGDVADELKLNASPYDLCVVDNTTVAAAVDDPGGIRVVTVTPTKLSLASVINTDNPWFCIAYRYGGFVVSTGKEVCSVSEDGTTHKLHTYSSNVNGMSHDLHHGRMLITHFTPFTGRSAISRLSDDNKHTDVLGVGAVRYAFEVDVDLEGNVYVCGWSSNNVVQMSGDGTNVRKLLTAADGVVQPRAISVCGDKIVVTNQSVRHSNYIRLFQLV